ncbi:hypothetical protein [Cohnella panacarvi]|uniref:hypothetical protein n=1 Tax=Cohnella panacarvi TaxID=400776 RepID=UPI00047A1F45|nr:hypothetical protein [Cohnella panacarvi]
MAGKILLLLIVYAVIGLADLARLRKLHSREMAVYSAALLLTVYLGIDFAWDLKWPFIEEAAFSVLGKPAEFLVKILTVPS